MTAHANHLDWINWIDDQAPAMTALVARLANINSHSFNLSGLKRVAYAARDAFADWPDEVHIRDLPPIEQINDRGQPVAQPVGPALHLIKRPDAHRRVLLAIHLDTVYPPDSPFQEIAIRGQQMIGPGVADAKGGLVVMLTALRAFEQSGAAADVGFHVILNPDEEIGSPASSPLLQRIARQCHIGLVFEPTLPNGEIVSSRGGSANYTLVVEGQSAHVGRDAAAGRSAVGAICDAVDRLDQMTDPTAGIIVNVACLNAHSPLNVVPALAIARLNIRFTYKDQITQLSQNIDHMLRELQVRRDVTAQWLGNVSAPAKPLDPPTCQLIDTASQCARTLGFHLIHRHTAGVCDGNRLAAAGLPTLDTLGPCGNHLHTPRETLDLPSLTQRAKLTTCLLHEIATRDVLADPKSEAGR